MTLHTSWILMHLYGSWGKRRQGAGVNCQWLLCNIVQPMLEHCSASLFSVADSSSSASRSFNCALTLQWGWADPFGMLFETAEKCSIPQCKPPAAGTCLRHFWDMFEVFLVCRLKRQVAETGWSKRLSPEWISYLDKECVHNVILF